MYAARLAGASSSEEAGARGPRWEGGSAGMVRASVWIGPGWWVQEGDGVWLTDGGRVRRGGYIPHSEALRGSFSPRLVAVVAAAMAWHGDVTSSPVMPSAHCSPPPLSPCRFLSPPPTGQARPAHACTIPVQRARVPLQPYAATRSHAPYLLR